MCLQKLKLLSPKEEGTPVRPVIGLNVDARRIRFWEEDTVVADFSQRRFEKVEMVDLLRIS